MKVHEMYTWLADKDTEEDINITDGVRVAELTEEMLTTEEVPHVTEVNLYRGIILYDE